MCWLHWLHPGTACLGCVAHWNVLHGATWCECIQLGQQVLRVCGGWRPCCLHLAPGWLLMTHTQE